MTDSGPSGFEEWNTPRKYVVLAGASATAFILTGLICAGLVYSGLGHWIELFNGATWPNVFIPSDDATKAQRDATYGFWFFVVLAARTFINLGVVLSAILAVSWLVAGGLGRLVMKQVETYAKMRTAALVGEMINVLQQSGVHLEPEVEERLYTAASDFDGKTQIGAALRKGAEAARAAGV